MKILGIALIWITLFGLNSAQAWQPTFGVVLGDFSFSLNKGVRLHLVTQSDLSPTQTYFRKHRSVLGFSRAPQEADQILPGCFREVILKDGKLDSFQYLSEISDDVAKDLVKENKYAKNSRIEVGVSSLGSDDYRYMVVVYDSRNAPVEVFNGEFAKLPFTMSLGETYAQAHRACPK